MSRELVAHNRPVFDQLHPNIYRAAAGLVAWFALAAWVLFDRGSDIDILVEIDPAAGVTIFDYVALKDYIATLFEGPVDVIDRDALKPHLRQPSARDAVYAF